MTPSSPRRTVARTSSLSRPLSIALALTFVAFGVTACGSEPPPTAEQVVRQLGDHVRTSNLVTVVDAASDPNKLLGRPNGYLSKAVFADSRIDSDALLGAAGDGMEQGGSVEVFADEDGATARRTYIQEIGKRLPIVAGEYDFQNGPILLRASRQLTPPQAAEYSSALSDIVAGKAPAPALPVGPPASQVQSAQPAKPGAISVASVHDAATVVLTDGTRLRQLGISAPGAEACHAKEATAATDAEVRQGPITYQLLGQTDVFGNQWAYIQVASADLGEKLASLGWVWAYPDSPAPDSYDQRIATQVETARSASRGLFSSACPGAATPPQGVAQPSVVQQAKTIDDGTYVLGTEIEPGTYRTTGASEDAMVKMCSWKRLKDTSGEFSSIIATNIAQGPTTITIKPTDGAFESRGCATWKKIG
jgi:endonuclease YncB( thermonuclease family)